MKFTKVLSDVLPSCYAVSRIYHGSHDYLLVASEVEEACLAYDVNRNFEKTQVWGEVGGTMSIIQIPESMDFLATQRFYPGFDAASCRIVRGTFQGAGQWEISEVTSFPYLHRFDLVEHGGKILFIGCTIANSKAFSEDWSDDGKIFVGQFDTKKNNILNLEELSLRLKKNHGYYEVHDQAYSLITGVEGIFRLDYPGEDGQWHLTKIFGEETSDIVQLDVDGDGRLENAIIQDFHGDRFRILSEDFKEERFTYPEATPFGHALWAGSLLGKEVFLFGWRAGKKDFVAFHYQDGRFVQEVIEAGVASSNCLAFEKEGKAYIFSANNGQHIVGLYEMKKENTDV
ncbi:hypothetical protein [Streptococcus sciuri]|uniref:Uncharacterized protein n=1 Tax=Streptococcus sciuri TaxID=2973939 RepID=A0ABT2F6A1_9STRE|nr:hypothetical protein [Streptococcus sciuri]MCS4488003.1 hypothetical protein [Streptococcus sciuri]